jgi:hypothetical protein
MCRVNDSIKADLIVISILSNDLALTCTTVHFVQSFRTYFRDLGRKEQTQFLCPNVLNF